MHPVSLLQYTQQTQLSEQPILSSAQQSTVSSTASLWFYQFSVSFNNYPCTTSLGLIRIERLRRPPLHRRRIIWGNQHGMIILVHHLLSAKVIFRRFNIDRRWASQLERQQ
jgi:hypothetical protein